MGWWACNIKGGRQESRVWADGGKCRKMKEKKEIGIWVIQVTRCECCRRAGGAAVGWGQRGSHLVLPNPSMAEFLMAQPLVWYIHFWRRGYGHSSESPLGQMCVEPPLDLDFPHTVKVNNNTKRAKSKSARMTMETAHSACQTRNPTSSLLTNLPTILPHPSVCPILLLHI